MFTSHDPEITRINKILMLLKFHFVHFYLAFNFVIFNFLKITLLSFSALETGESGDGFFFSKASQLQAEIL